MIEAEGLKLTTYVARHTFATTLKRSGIGTSAIGELLGHESEAVTQTYLKELERSELDKVDEGIL